MKMMNLSLSWTTLTLLWASTSLSAQDISSNPASAGSIFNRSDARTITLEIPAPRGLITDRNGRPFAQTKVVYEVVLKFPQFQEEDEQYILSWAKKKVALVNSLLGISVELEDSKLLSHYRNRRWLPLVLSTSLQESEAKDLQSKLGDGLELQATYTRTYPQKTSLAHVIGYVGRVGKALSGPITYREPLFQALEGRSGLEKIFDKRLSGRPGERKMLFDSDGSKILDEIVKPAETGQTIITTINLKWQKVAERVLREKTRRGAFVVIDIQSGEVLALASRPSFDLNKFVPSISSKDYAELRDDESRPLFGRAFQAGYPPASTFKPVVTLAAISNNIVSPEERINCPPKVKIGEVWFRNWTKSHEGKLDARKALARSANPYFYEVGVRTGSNAFLGMARRLGFGKKTGLPLMGETAGNIPTHQWMEEHYGRRITSGDAANMAIGQGVILASPLQVAQAMAGIGNGNSVPTLHLIKQVQDINGRVVVAARPKEKSFLSATERAQKAAKGGMKDVVHAGYGTGKKADIGYATLCGKTGTAQWIPAKDQRLAWFSGFLPYKNPRFAFVALYEGAPGEQLSGGRKAAPMVKQFFQLVKSDVQKALKPPPKAVAIVLEDEIEEEVEVEEEEDEGFLEVEEAELAPIKLEVEKEVGKNLEEPARAEKVDESTLESSAVKAEALPPTKRVKAEPVYEEGFLEESAPRPLTTEDPQPFSPLAE